MNIHVNTLLAKSLQWLFFAKNLVNFRVLNQTGLPHLLDTWTTQHGQFISSYVHLRFFFTLKSVATAAALQLRNYAHNYARGLADHLAAMTY